MQREDLVPYPAEAVQGFKDAGLWRDETLFDWLDRNVAARPGHPALVQGDRTLSYAEMAAEAERLAGGLASLGLVKGDVVAVQLPNVIEFVLAFHAITRIGGVMQTIHMPYRGAELEHLLDHSGARAVICVPAFRDYATAQVMGELTAKLANLEHVIVHGPAPDGAVALADLYTRGDAGDVPRPAPDDPSVMLYTSGTTSSPKGVVVDSRPFLNNARLSVTEFEITPEDVFLCPAPFSHLYGLCALQNALCAGATSYLLPAFTPPDFVAAIGTGKATVLYTGPAHHAACRQAGLYDDADLSSVRIVVTSGSACPPALAEYVDGLLLHGKSLQLWGMTELQAGTYNRPGDSPAQRYNTAGFATPGNEIRVVGDDGGALPAGAEGELQIRGCSVFPGYYNNDEANAESFTDGWFRTGDLAIIDGDGYLTITGRIKDVINRGGVKFNPADIENLINGMAQVQMSAIVPVADDVLGERACVYVQPAAGAEISLADITAHLEAHQVAKNKWPEQLELVDAMPLTPTMKVIKGRLKPASTS